MIPFDIVTVDSSFLTLLFSLAGILPFIGVFFGFMIYRMTAGPASRAAWAAKRKKAPTLFHMGRDGIFKLWPVKRSFGGVWHAGNVIDVIPDERSVKSLEGGTPSGVASTNAAATLDPEWVYYTNRFADAFSKAIKTDLDETIPKMSPSMASNYLDALRYRESEVQTVLETLNKLQNGEISMEDGVAAAMAERGVDPSDEATKERIRAALKGAVETQGEAYIKELARIRAAKTIRFTEDRWVIDWDIKQTTKPLSFKKAAPIISAKGVVAIAPIRLNDFQAFLQTGANLDDLTTALRNSTMAALLENTMARGQQFRWISLGIFIFIVFLSFYVILQGLHLA